MAKKDTHYVCVNPMICNKNGFQPSSKCAIQKCRFVRKIELNTVIEKKEKLSLEW